MKEQRKDDILFCQEHGKLYRFKSGNDIICVSPGCEYRELDKRKDSDIPEVKDNTWR